MIKFLKSRGLVALALVVNVNLVLTFSNRSPLYHM